jgi:hypothetical protein
MKRIILIVALSLLFISPSENKKFSISSIIPFLFKEGDFYCGTETPTV